MRRKIISCWTSINKLIVNLILCSLVIFLIGSPALAYSTPIGFNGDDYQKLVAFLDLPCGEGKNGHLIDSNFDPRKPRNWTGVQWTSSLFNKRLVSIEWEDKGFCGIFEGVNFPELTKLVITGGELREIDVSGCKKLKELNCQNNALVKLETINCIALTKLNCGNNELTNLRIENLMSLIHLNCQNNKLENLPFSDLSSLKELFCGGNDFLELSLEELSELVTFNCLDSNLTRLSFENLEKLIEVDLQNNKLRDLIVEGCPVLKELDISHNELQSLTLENLPGLEKLDCSVNYLEELKLKNLQSIKWLNCSHNKLKFSRLPLFFDRELEQYIYCPQEKLEIGYKGIAYIDVPIDLSSEYDIEGSETIYSWFIYQDEDTIVVRPEELEGGVFIFNGPSYEDKTVFCRITNNIFFELLLETNCVLLKEAVPVLEIIEQPQDTIVAEGSEASLKVLAQAPPNETLTFQWQVELTDESWAAIEGALEEVYEMEDVLARQDGYRYRCEVSSLAEGEITGTIQSEAASLTVIANPLLEKQAQDQASLVGGEIEFSIEVINPDEEKGGILTCQWQVQKDNSEDWFDVSDANDLTLTIENVSYEEHNCNKYRASLINERLEHESQEIFSDTVTLIVVTEAEIKTEPADEVVAIGANADFTLDAQASRGAELVCQWEISLDEGASWKELKGATSLTCSIGDVTLDDRGQLVRCKIASKKGEFVSETKTSNSASLDVVPDPKIVSHPEDIESQLGETITFSVTAEIDDQGTALEDGLKYHWQYSTNGGETWLNVPAAKSPEYTIQKVTKNHNNNQYRCQVNNELKNVWSNNIYSYPACLSVDIPYEINFIKPSAENDIDNPLTINSGSLVIVDIEGNLDEIISLTISLDDDEEVELTPSGRIYYLLKEQLQNGEHTLTITLVDERDNVFNESVVFHWRNYRRGFGFGRLEFE